METSTVTDSQQSRVRNDLFDNRIDHDRGASALKFAVWYLTKCLFFLSALPWPSSLKVWLLKRFGAQMGNSVYIKPRVNIHYPWKVSIGDHTWVGEEVCIINFNQVTIGKHCCLSQRATLCAANHDYRDVSMKYRHAPITLDDGVWVGAMSFIGPGVHLKTDTVVSAAAMVNATHPANTILQGNPAVVVGHRWQQGR